MIKIYLLVATLIAISVSSNSLFGQPWTAHGKLIVSKDNPHYLQHEDGTQFFWFGDTGWELLHRANRKEADFYLENRSKKGFNVIQTVILSEFVYMDKFTNYYTDSLFQNEDPGKPMITPGNNPDNAEEYDYWDHIDYIVRLAEAKGLYMALVPTWGEWVIPRSGKSLFDTNEQAYNYGWFVGNRYKNSTNIIWILGGDRHPDERNVGVELWRAMAEGLADGTNNIKKLDGQAEYSTTLITHHSFNSSSNWFHNDAWIDFHTWGSYHHDVNVSRSYELASKDWTLPNPKPTINSEPCYESHPINYAVPDNGVFVATDMRTAAYWSLFSGCAGFTYGSNPVWQFTDSVRPKFNGMTFNTWQQGLELPGAVHVSYLKKLMESRPMKGLLPDQSLILNQGSGSGYMCAIRNSSYAFVYTPVGNSITLQLGVVSGSKVKAWWFDPRKGTSSLIGEIDNSGSKTFEVPGMSKELAWLKTGRGCDWVLVIDDASKGFSEPGK